MTNRRKIKEVVALELLHKIGKYCPKCHSEFSFTSYWADLAKRLGIQDLKVIPPLTRENNPSNQNFSHKNMLTIEHKKPLVLGGTNSRSNLSLLCMTCNTEQSSRYSWHCQTCNLKQQLDVNYCWKCGEKSPAHSGVDYKKCYYEQNSHTPKISEATRILLKELK